MPILEADQGVGKSRTVDVLFAPWFSDDLAELGSKDAAMQTHGAWGIELAELSAMTRSEIERIKAFVSRRTDRYRPAYGRRVIEAPRQSVFVGTTNASEYLKDETGNRRFLPILCRKIDDTAIARDRDQLWAEAVHLYKHDTEWWIDARDADAREQQDMRRETDVWQNPIDEFLEKCEETTVSEILKDCLGIEPARQGRAEQTRVGRCLKTAGWQRFQQRQGGKRRWVHRRG
jgi:predicted P-loop ATPase